MALVTADAGGKLRLGEAGIPIITWIAASMAAHLVPDRIAFRRGLLIVYLAGIGGFILFATTWHWAWRMPGL